MATSREVEAYPLDWPEGRPRTQANERQGGQFQTTPGVARDSLFEELRKLGANYPVVSSDIPLRLDGLPYAGRQSPDDPGVAVYFEYNGTQFVFACDRYDLIHKNLRAVALTVSALRGIERWGTGEMMRQAFSGFAALPEPADETRWWTVLVLPSDASLAEAEAAYRGLARKAHPDSGGSGDEMARLNVAIAGAREANSP